MKQQQLRHCQPISPAEPLWQRVPTRDADGRALFDFMMLIPRLRSAPEQRRNEVLEALQQVFDGFGDEVVFADLNLKTNLLWVSHKPRKGAMLELAEAVIAKVPEAVLIANKAEAQMGARRIGWKRRFARKLLT
ncbi:hypothetical protein [Solemya velesiana gill symbiont]|uniref:Uncharacterized protein n=1 Tax=Solemya velesiana gill symbiont TaxID=1918948 RepID=A0A1T2KTH0_9GAMM|nr:hypothetical protein [Solemya velesiana gill symbiont]OOZ36091.1 hypothetical protein BOW51_08860 [Solemya velesiana gill symbiont]